MSVPRVTVFGPHPLLSVVIERRGERDDIHLHAGGQGVWASRMAGELGAWPLLCAFCGGEPGVVIEALLAGRPGERRLVRTAAASGSYVVDRRQGDGRIVASAFSDPPSRHELDALVSEACAAAVTSGVALIANPFPGDALPVETYGQIVADAKAGGALVLVDLSSPRLDAALESRPDVVKVNDWELAEYAGAPVDGPALRPAAQRLLDAGAGTAIVTRGPDPALVLRDGEARWLIPPRFERGFREGCGDTMMGALCASLAKGVGWDDALRIGAAAGAAAFLRHGLGSPVREVVEQLVERVELRPY